jgi:hypothetical protein
MLEEVVERGIFFHKILAVIILWQQAFDGLEIQ